MFYLSVGIVKNIFISVHIHDHAYIFSILIKLMKSIGTFITVLLAPTKVICAKLCKQLGEGLNPIEDDTWRDQGIYLHYDTARPRDTRP